MYSCSIVHVQFSHIWFTYIFSIVHAMRSLITIHTPVFFVSVFCIEKLLDPLDINMDTNTQAYSFTACLFIWLFLYN